MRQAAVVEPTSCGAEEEEADEHLGEEGADKCDESGLDDEAASLTSLQLFVC
jgi:hypothetical protein